MKRLSIVLTCLAAIFAGPAQAVEHTLLATPATVSWGYYSGASKATLTVQSGDTVRMQTLSTCGSPELMMSRGVKREDIPLYTDAIYKEVTDKGPAGTSSQVPWQSPRPNLATCWKFKS